MMTRWNFDIGLLLPKTVLPPLFCLLLCLITPIASSAADLGTYGQGVNIKADTMTHDINQDIIRASGAVLVEWQGMTLMALDATYNQSSQTITASGNVVLIKG